MCEHKAGVCIAYNTSTCSLKMEGAMHKCHDPLGKVCVLISVLLVINTVTLIVCALHLFR